MSAERRLIEPVPPRSVARDLLTVLSGTAGAQLVGLLILPVLARTFAPEAFGIFQLYLSLLIFLTVAVALRIELTLLSKPHAEVHQTVATLFGLVLVVSLLVSLVLALYTVWQGSVGFPVALLGLGLVGNGFTQVASYKLIRDQEFSRLAFVKVSQVIVYAVVALAIAASHPTPLGLVCADVTGRLAAGGIAVQVVRRGGTSLSGMMSLLKLPRFVRRHRDMAIISLPGALANSAGAMLTPFMIYLIFGPAAAGQFGLVDRAIGVPVAMLVNAASQVFAGRVAEQLRAENRQSVRRLLRKVVLSGVAVCGAGSAIAYVLIPFVFKIAFGPDWPLAIDLARVLVFSYAIGLAVGVVNQLLVSLGAFRLQSGWDLCWPICIGAVWVVVVVLKLDLHTAVVLHACAVGGLWLVFLKLCSVALRGPAPPPVPAGGA